MRMPPRRVIALVAVGLASYLVILLANFPAAVAWSLVVPAQAPVTAQAIHGTLWSGHLDKPVWGPLRLQQLSWNVSPWDLLIGHLAAQIRIQSHEAQGSARVDYLGAHHWRLDGVQANLVLGRLSRALPGIHLHAEGTLHLAFAHLTLRGPALEGLDGTGSARQITIRSLVPITLSALQLKAQSGRSGISRITFTTGPGGSLITDGHVRLTPNGHWNLFVRFKPAASASATLTRFLAGYGIPGPGGFYTLHLEGILPPLTQIEPGR